MKFNTQLISTWRRLVYYLKKHAKLVLLAMAATTLLLILGGVYMHFRPHKTPIFTTSTHNKIPQTGASLVFRKPLTGPIQLEIDDASDHKVAVYTLTTTATSLTSNTIVDTKGTTFNIPLAEGVYSFKISDANSSVMAIEQTVTVPAGRLTKVNIGII